MEEKKEEKKEPPPKFPNGQYIFGYAPTETKNGQMHFLITLLSDKIIALTEISSDSRAMDIIKLLDKSYDSFKIYKNAVQWCLNSGETCIGNTNIGYKYWLIEQK